MMILAVCGIVAVFTVWNIIDFFTTETRGLMSYLAIGLNLVAVALAAQAVAREVKRARRK